MCFLISCGRSREKLTEPLSSAGRGNSPPSEALCSARSCPSPRRSPTAPRISSPPPCQERPRFILAFKSQKQTLTAAVITRRPTSKEMLKLRACVRAPGGPTERVIHAAPETHAAAETTLSSSSPLVRTRISSFFSFATSASLSFEFIDEVVMESLTF